MNMVINKKKVRKPAIKTCVYPLWLSPHSIAKVFCQPIPQLLVSTYQQKHCVFWPSNAAVHSKTIEPLRKKPNRPPSGFLANAEACR